MPEPAPRGRVVGSLLAFDFGLRRIGVAIGQTVTGSASPLGTVDNSASGPDYDRIARLIGEWQPDALVVGMPTQADGTPGKTASRIREFIAELERFDLPVSTVDERHTSQEAEATLKTARRRGRRGRRGRIRKTDIDAASAVLIAERYLRSLGM